MLVYHFSYSPVFAQLTADTYPRPRLRTGSTAAYVLRRITARIPARTRGFTLTVKQIRKGTIILA